MHPDNDSDILTLSLPPSQSVRCAVSTKIDIHRAEARSVALRNALNDRRNDVFGENPPQAVDAKLSAGLNAPTYRMPMRPNQLQPLTVTVEGTEAYQAIESTRVCTNALRIECRPKHVLQYQVDIKRAPRDPQYLLRNKRRLGGGDPNRSARTPDRSTNSPDRSMRSPDRSAPSSSSAGALEATGSALEASGSFGGARSGTGGPAGEAAMEEGGSAPMEMEQKEAERPDADDSRHLLVAVADKFAWPRGWSCALPSAAFEEQAVAQGRRHLNPSLGVIVNGKGSRDVETT